MSNNTIQEIQTQPNLTQPNLTPPNFDVEIHQTISASKGLKKEIERYIRLSKREKKIEQAKNLIKNKIIEFCNKKPSIINFGQEQIAKVNSKEKTSFDVAGLTEIAPELAAKFVRKTSYLELRCS